jgi:agmatine deiminase
MPGEFEPHAGCWLLWPERGDNWREEARPAQAAFAAVATAIAKFEPVTMGASKGQLANARAQLPKRVRVVQIPSDDAWMRDVGPTIVVNQRGERRGIDWRFNAWGGLNGGVYVPWDRDERVAQQVLSIEGINRYRAPLILEGGAIHVDGEGTCITTEECVLNPNRNPDLTREQTEEYLRAYLGVEVIIWLGRGVYLDETDGHIDNLCCFVRPGELCLTWTDDPQDPQHAISHDAYERLAQARDARGRRFKIYKLTQPGPLYSTAEEARGVRAAAGTRARPAGQRLAGSYVNFYIANRGIVLPLLDAKRDRGAVSVLKRAFPGRRVVGVPAREILLGGGNIHCITQQIPRTRKSLRRS